MRFFVFVGERLPAGPADLSGLCEDVDCRAPVWLDPRAAAQKANNPQVPVVCRECFQRFLRALGEVVRAPRGAPH